MNTHKKNPAAKGRCYETAFGLLTGKPGQYLCHGTPVQTKPPYRRMGHAWLEECRNGKWYCRDGLFPQRLIPRGDYYVIGQIKYAEVVRYTAKQALALAEEHGYIGPWDRNTASAVHKRGSKRKKQS